MSKKADHRVGILYIDDCPTSRAAISEKLQSRYQLIDARPSELDRQLSDPAVELVLSELSIGDSMELDILSRLGALGIQKPVVILTCRGNEHWAVEAMKRGAADYISKNAPGYLDQLQERLDRARQFADERDRSYTKSLDLLCIAGFDGYLKRWSPLWGNLMGYTREELMSLPYTQLVHLDDRASAAEMGRKLRAGESVQGVEARVRCRDGSYKWLLWHGIPCVEQQLFFAIAHDITYRKQIEQQLRESQERFLLLAEVTNEAVWDWDLRNNRIWRNENFFRRFGVPDEAAEGTIEWWRSRVHPEDRQRVLESAPTHAVDGQQNWAIEYRLRGVEDNYIKVFDRGFVICDEQGNPVRMAGSIIDITQLKNAEAKLQESEERFRLASKATRDAIWDWDLRKDQVWRSEGFQTLFGYSPEQVKEDLDWWVERIHPDDRKRVLSQIPSDGSPSPQQSAFEYRFRRADGSYADVFDRGFVMLDSEGRPLRMIGSIMDMSERKRAQELAHRQRAELAHIARVSTMGEIATGLAHELNQPLTAIANYAESCQHAINTRLPGEERLQGWIEKIAANTHRAGEMIRRLRGFTRKSEPRRSTVDINELVREVIDLLEADTRLHDIRIRWQPSDKSLHTLIDRVQIQQVLVNLLLNAYEAMTHNADDQRQATIVATAHNGHVDVSVSDLGEGIPAQDAEKVFEAFFTTKAEGVGIGLAISRSIVEDHGGRLWLTPNPEQGVTFRFTLPMTGVENGAVTNGVRRRR